MIPEDALAAFVDACRDAGRRGLVPCSSGNMSCRFDDTRMLVSTSRTWLERITPDRVALCDIADGSVLHGGKPTVEIEFHRGILRHRPEVNVILHFQTPFATTLACRTDLFEINFMSLPEIPYYMGRVGVVPYLTPGSPELAEVVVEVMKTHDVAILSNHGMVTVAKDYDHAIQNAVFFELACRMIVQAGDKLSPLTEEAIAHLIAAGESGGAV